MPKNGAAGNKSQSAPNLTPYVAGMVVSPIALKSMNLKGKKGVEKEDGQRKDRERKQRLGEEEVGDEGEGEKEKLTTPLEEVMVSPVTLDLKVEEMPGHATTLEAADPGPPTTTNSLKLNPTNPTTKAG
jgi:hypothetical protein